MFQQGGAKLLTQQGLPESPVAHGLVCGMHVCPPPRHGPGHFGGVPCLGAGLAPGDMKAPFVHFRDPSGRAQGGQRTLCQGLGCCPASPPPPSRRADASGPQWK